MMITEPKKIEFTIAQLVDATRIISIADAKAMVEGKTEKNGGVNPSIWFNIGAENGRQYRIGEIPLDLFVANEDGYLYDSTVNVCRAHEYSNRSGATAPPVIAVLGKKSCGLLRILDGGHRISAARIRGDYSISAIVSLGKFIENERPKSQDILKSLGLEWNAVSATGVNSGKIEAVSNIRKGLQMLKTYLAGWGSGYIEPAIKQVGIEHFNDNNGYDVDEIAAIENLDVGETFSFSGTPSGDHVVVRLANDVLIEQSNLSEIDPLTTTANEFSDYINQHQELFTGFGSRSNNPLIHDSFDEAAAIAIDKPDGVGMPPPNSTYTGIVMGNSSLHVVLSIGRGAIIYEKSDLNRVPEKGEEITVVMKNGKGVVSPLKKKSNDISR